MSRKQNWYVRRYVRAVSGFLPCSGKVKKPLLDALRAQAEEYIADGGDAACIVPNRGFVVTARFENELIAACILLEKLCMTARHVPPRRLNRAVAAEEAAKRILESE